MTSGILIRRQLLLCGLFALTFVGCKRDQDSSAASPVVTPAPKSNPQQPEPIKPPIEAKSGLVDYLKLPGKVIFARKVDPKVIRGVLTISKEGTYSFDLNLETKAITKKLLSDKIVTEVSVLGTPDKGDYAQHLEANFSNILLLSIPEYEENNYSSFINLVYNLDQDQVMAKLKRMHIVEVRRKLWPREIELAAESPGNQYKGDEILRITLASDGELKFIERFSDVVSSGLNYGSNYLIKTDRSRRLRNLPEAKEVEIARISSTKKELEIVSDNRVCSVKAAHIIEEAKLGEPVSVEILSKVEREKHVYVNIGYTENRTPDINRVATFELSKWDACSTTAALLIHSTTLTRMNYPFIFELFRRDSSGVLFQFEYGLFYYNKDTGLVREVTLAKTADWRDDRILAVDDFIAVITGLGRTDIYDLTLKPIQLNLPKTKYLKFFTMPGTKVNSAEFIFEDSTTMILERAIRFGYMPIEFIINLVKYDNTFYYGSADLLERNDQAKATKFLLSPAWGKNSILVAGESKIELPLIGTPIFATLTEDGAGSLVAVRSQGAYFIKQGFDKNSLAIEELEALYKNGPY